MPPSAPLPDEHAGPTEFYRALDSGGPGRTAGAVVAAQGDAATAAPHLLSAPSPAARPEGRTADAGPHALVAAAAARDCCSAADRGACRSAAGAGAECGGRRPPGAGDRQWLERRQELGRAPECDRRPVAWRRR